MQIFNSLGIPSVGEMGEHISYLSILITEQKFFLIPGIPFIIF